MKKYKATYLPVFFLIDVSYSMLEEKPGGGTLLDAANQLVPGIVEACEKYSVLDQRLRLGLIEFCDEARVVIPLSEIDAFSENIPQLVAKGGTNFAAAFWAVFNEMGVAVESLRKPEIGIHRPTVFFITDGEDIGDVQRSLMKGSVIDQTFSPLGWEMQTLKVLGPLNWGRALPQPPRILQGLYNVSKRSLTHLLAPL